MIVFKTPSQVESAPLSASERQPAEPAATKSEGIGCCWWVGIAFLVLTARWWVRPFIGGMFGRASQHLDKFNSKHGD